MLREVQQGEPLDECEQEVLRLYSLGRSELEIAREMAYSRVQVSRYCRRACVKDGAKNRTEAVYLATKRGML